MSSKPSPTLLRRQLGAELRRLREAARKTAAEVAAELKWSESKVSRIETANSSIRNPDLTKLFDLYQTAEAERTRITALATQSRQRAWWEAYGDALLGAYETYIGFESEAAEIFIYDAVILHGLLQTVEYAGAIINSVSVGERPDVVSQRVSVRMARQAVLTRDPPPKIRAILDEAVLKRAVGGTDVMKRQLMRLLEIADRPTVTLQMVPFDRGAHRGVDGTFTVLEFANETEPPIVYCDGMTGGVFRNRPEEVRRYLVAFESLRTVALSHTETLDYIQRAIREFE
ncbi:helix-turn-helix domain-containing protein [Dactylosporangium sp. NPDC000521]|uniref:helix-turn-helix domain-containing protein n=1 Tax=Dactylosporangium sp. NPDC000521 TaxID=3363975 RepID=UPI0036825331